MPTPEEVLADFTKSQNELRAKSGNPIQPSDRKLVTQDEVVQIDTPDPNKNVVKSDVPKLPNDPPIKTVVRDTPNIPGPTPVRDESITHTPGIQHTFSKTPSRGNVGEASPRLTSNPISSEITDRFVETVVNPSKRSTGPHVPNEKEPITDRRADLPHVPTTGARFANLGQNIARMQVPPQFMEKIAVILKDSGADSMSQEKALARIGELIYPVNLNSPDASISRVGTSVSQNEHIQSQKPVPDKIHELPKKD